MRVLRPLLSAVVLTALVASCSGTPTPQSTTDTSSPLSPSDAATQAPEPSKSATEDVSAPSTVFSIDGDLAQLPGGVTRLNAAQATQAIQFTGDLEAESHFIMNPVTSYTAGTTKNVSVWGQLQESYEYVATSTVKKKSGVRTSLGLIDQTGEFTKIKGSGKYAVVPYLVTNGRDIVWIEDFSAGNTTDEFTIHHRTPDGTILNVQSSELPHAGGQLVPESLGVSLLGIVHFVTLDSSGTSHFYTLVGRDVSEISEREGAYEGAPVSSMTGFLYAQHEKDASVVSFSTVDDSDERGHAVFSLGGPVSPTNFLIGSQGIRGVYYSENEFADNPAYVFETEAAEGLTVVEVANSLPSSTATCGSTLTWASFDGESNSSQVFHLDTAAPQQTLYSLDLEGGAVVRCADNGFIVENYDSATADVSVWHVEFDESA